MRDDLVDRIYECAFAPELWADVLGDMAEIASARVGFLFVSRGDVHRWSASTEAGVEALRPLVESGWIARCERFRRFLTARSSGFVTEADIYPSGGTEDDPFYRDILYPRGLGHATGMVIGLPTGDSFAINVERELARGPVEPEAIARLNSLRPHLSRAAVMSARLQMERARAMAQTLASLGQAALVFGPGGRVIAANSLIEALSPPIVWRARDRLALGDSRADALLQAAIIGIDTADAEEVRSFPVRDSEDQATMIAHVVPIRRSARDIFARCAGVLVLTPLSGPDTPSLSLVRLLFDLTPAEARVACDLAGGRAVDDIALGGGVSPNTVRTQVRRILEKTGCRRTVDLVAMLTGMVTSRPRPID